MTRPADARARAVALEPERSFIVQAPAGSGKTELLTQRMLRLLARVEQPEEVVAITFTRKAAAEMRHRIVAQLDAAERPADPAGLKPHEQLSRHLARAVLENNRQRGWNLRDQPARLRVRTIDSLCGELARQLPLLSGLGGKQRVTERPEALYRRAAERTMAAIEQADDELQADVERVLARYANQYDRLVELISGMLGRRDQWLEFLLEAHRGGFDRAALEESLAVLVGGELEHARALLPEELAAGLPRFLRYSLRHEPADAAAVEALLAHCNPAGCLALPVDAGSLPLWSTLADRLLTKGGGWWARAQGRHGFPANNKVPAAERDELRAWKDDFKALLDRLRPEEELRAQLELVRGLPAPRYDDDAWSALESLVRILLRAAAEWQLVLADTGGADFTEVARRAIQALGDDGEPSDLALRLDYRISHLLVDEFQDTSHGQVRLLERLTAGWSAGDGRTLFLVGDPMQSIYRFRKAEVSLFIRACEGGLFGQLGLETLKLTVNFRSAAPVVDWVNRVFPEVMPEEDDTVTGAVRYSPSETAPGAPEEGRVSLQFTAAREDAEEARRVADLVAACPADDSIAILVRSRNHASEILALFDRLKTGDPRYRYRAVEFTPLAETPLIRDLLSLTLALEQPADRLSWLALLRAPFIGLDLADLDALAGGRDAPVVPEAIAASLGAGGSVLTPAGTTRLQRSGPVLLDAMERVGRGPIRDRVESAWLRLGGPACARHRGELADADAYFDLLDALEAEGLAVDRDSLNTRLGDLYAQPDADAGERLQVMTIYGAKGLEFGTVILPGLNRQTRGNDPQLLHWFELAESDQVVMCAMRDVRERLDPAGDLVSYIGTVERRRQSMETGRLLYVAATRAVRQLHLLAAVAPRLNDRVAPRGDTLAASLWPAVGEEQSDAILADAEQRGDAPEPGEDPLPQVHRRLRTNWTLPVPPGAVEQFPPEPESTAEYVEFRWAGEAARLAGNLVHRLLQEVAEAGEERWRARGGFAAAESWCRAKLKAEGVAGAAAEPVIDRARRALERCLASERGRWILAARDEAASELALTAVLGGRPVNLVIDRSFVDAGERWIVDYKTGEHRGGDLEGFLESEVERYRPQLQRYRAALALSESRPIRTALYFPLIDRFLEV